MYKKVVIVMSTDNAAKTLIRIYQETISQDYVDLVILVDDASQDATLAIAENLEYDNL